MSKKRNVMEFNNDEMQVDEVALDEAVVEEPKNVKVASFNEEQEPVTDEPTNDGESQEGESTLSFEDAGCRAFGDTVLTFPSLPNKEFLDYRAGVVINCFEHQPSVMEPVTVSK